jgi:hypothetical protein
LTADEDSSDNVFTTTAQVISPYSHTLTLDPITVTARIGAEETLRLRVNNTGPLADAYTFTVDGLDPAWYTPIEDSFPLNSGGSATADLNLRVSDCVFTGAVPFSVTAHSQEGGEAVSVETSLTLLPDPLQLDLTPANESTLGARSAPFSWRTDAPTTGQLTLYPTLLPEEIITQTTPLSTIHQVVIENLDRNLEYSWFIESESSCGYTTSPSQTFTVGNGLVFAQRDQSHTIPHDYNQEIEIEVKNEDLSQAHTLRVLLNQPYEDLIANFVGAGSIDDEENYITLEPGESRNVLLVVHAQDATQEDYNLVAKIIANEGTPDEIVDYAHITLRVLRGDQFSLAFSYEDSNTLIKTYKVTNEGLPITDLNIQAIDPATGLPARALIQPTINHGRLDSGEEIEFQVIPLFSPEDAVALGDVASISNRPGPSTSPLRQAQEGPLRQAQDTASSSSGRFSGHGLASPLLQSQDPTVQLIVTTGNISQTQTSGFTCESPDQLYAVTWHNVLLSYENGDQYCTNRPTINMNFNTHGGINQADVSGANLSMRFMPKSNVRPHSAQFSMNGHQIGSFSNTIPQGIYNFEVNPAYLNYSTNPASAVEQVLGLRSQHPNGGHYVINTDNQLDLFLENFTQYCCAGSEEEAKTNCKLNNMQAAATNVDITIREPVPGSEVEQDNTVTLEAEVVDDVDDNVSYPVKAYISYVNHAIQEELDVPYMSTSLLGLGDIDYYETEWMPIYDGPIYIKMDVDATTAQDTDIIEVTVLSKPPDLSVEIPQPHITMVYGDPVAVEAIVTNQGDEVTQNFDVVFNYYKPANVPLEASGFANWIAEKGELINTETVSINGIGADESITVPSSFTPSLEDTNTWFIIEVEVDPPN